jgi:protein TonB
MDLSRRLLTSESASQQDRGWRRRFAGASGISAIVHTGLFALAMVALTADRQPAAYHVTPIRSELIVRIQVPGEGGGGGGHPAPAAAKEISIPKTRPPDPVPATPPPPQPEPPRPLPTLDAPVTTNADVLRAAGTSQVALQGPGGGGRGRDGIGPGDGNRGVGPGKDGGVGGGPRRPGDGVTNPEPIYKADPVYTVDAMRTKTSGEVILEATVEANGSVGALRVLKGLPFGLNDEAIKAAKRWKFKPAMADGKPVPIIVTIILEFNLR